VQYLPNLVRGEFVNVGVLLFAPQGRAEGRMLEGESELARLRRLHPHVDPALLRGVTSELMARLPGFEQDPAGHLDKLDESLSNVIQLGPQKGTLAESFDRELERLFDTLVAPPAPARRSAERRADSLGGIRRQANAIFATTGILRKMAPVRAAEFCPGDPLRVDYSWRSNGTRGFAQALVLNQGGERAKAWAYTSGRIRARAGKATFTAITEAEVRPEDERHAFVRDVLAEQDIEMVPLSRLYLWARDLSATIREQ
jgi:hypothetical protein